MYKRCPRSLWHYVEDPAVKARVSPSLPEWDRGRDVHEVLESLGRAFLAGASGPRPDADSVCAAAGALPVTAKRKRAAAAMVIDWLPRLDFTGTVAVEEASSVILGTANGTEMVARLVPDRVVEEPGRFLVVDYKTGPGLSSSEAETDWQAQIYLAWAREQRPDVERVSFRWEYIQAGDCLELDWTPEGDEWVRAQACAVGSWIARNDDRGAYLADPGAACYGCAAADVCGARAEWLRTARVGAARPSGELGELLAERVRLKALESEAEKARRLVDSEIEARMGTEGSVEHGERRALRVVQRRSYLSSGGVAAASRALGMEEVDVWRRVGSATLAALVKLGGKEAAPELMEALAPHLRVRRSSYLRVT